MGEATPSYERTPFGKQMLKHFAFKPGYRNLNHGSFGTFPTAIRDKATEFRDECEATPCPFIKFQFPKYLDNSRTAIAKFLNAPVSTVVFIPNATTGVNTVLRDIIWNPDGRDEILQFNIIYGACGNTTEYICESTAINYDQRIVNTREIGLTFPLSDADILTAFKSGIQASRAAGRRPRIAIFDTVVSIPGVRLPFEALTSICRSENVLSLIDGAHGIGHVNLDLSSLDPDFFVSNCHKWLFVPRGCAVFYVPERNQPLIRSTLPTSHGFIPKNSAQAPSSKNGKSAFVLNFEFTGTIDSTPYACVPEAIKWRQEVCGGEEEIRSYCRDLARKGGQKVAEILGTEVLDNEERTLTDCCLVNIRLPLAVREGGVIKPDDKDKVLAWMLDTVIREYGTFLQLYLFQGKFWVRISAQVYLVLEDFEWAGKTLKEVCGRVEKGEFFKQAGK